MADGPQLPFGYDPRRLLVGDVDGDGLADLVYIDDGRVTVWLNRCGNGWAAPVTLTGTPRTPIDDVRLADLLGSGVAGLLFSRETDASRPGLHHLDLTGGRKPYLLVGVTNNLGSSTEIEHRPSTVDYLRDLPDPATRWRTPLPFPVQVVARTAVTDHISGRRLTSRFAYHQGYWDGEEQEFRGFATVDEVDSDQPALGADGPSPAPGQAPVLTRTWFHQGPVEDGRGGWRSPDHTASFWSGDPQVLGRDGYDTAIGGLLAALPPRVRRDALRALRGAVLRTELYALDGGAYQDRPYTVTETCHAVAAVVDGPGGPRLVTAAADLPDAWGTEPAAVRVFFPHVVASRTTEWERADDPLSRFTFTAAFDALGRPHHETAVAAPRRSARRRPVVTSAGTVEPDETRLLATAASTEFAVPVGSAASGPGPPRYLHDLVHQIHRFELSQPPELVEAAPDDLGRVLRDTAAAATAVHAAALSALGGWAPGRAPPPGLALVGHELRYYDGTPFLGRPDGTVERGAHVRTEVLVGTDEDLDKAFSDPGDGAGAGGESRRPAYLGGPLPLPPGAPDGFGDDLGYRRRQAGAGPHQTGDYADTLRQRYDVQATGDPPRGWAAWPRFGVLIGDQDALGHTRTVEPDRYWLLTEVIRDAVGLTTTAAYDDATLLPAVVVDPNGTTTRQWYTPLGLPRARWWSGPDAPAAAVPEPQPDLSYAYDLHAFYRTRADLRPTPVHVHVTERVGPILRDGTAETLEWREYFDGLGRMVQRRTQAEDLGFAGIDGAGVGLPADISAVPGPATGDRATGRTVVSGWQRFDSKGRVAARYEPFFSSGWDYQPERDAAVGVATEYGYDPRGHLVLTLGPDGTQHREVPGYPVDEDDLALTAAEAAGAWPHAFRPTPWETYSFDPNDLAAVSIDPGTGGSLADRAPTAHRATPASRLVDPLGRVIFEVERAGAGPQHRHGTRTAHDLRATCSR
jgi:Insecticide toxin TcdB middle/N-terminal region/Insecticide toxin TcdB middle/C-terminal region